MYNLRYHIVSLVAVFLALSVGLVLGSVVVERGTVDRQRAALVDSLQREFDKINAANKVLQAQVDADSDFLREAVPFMVSGTLSGRTVLVLTNSGRTDGLASAQEAIRHAGGTPALVMLQAGNLGLDDTDVAQAANSVLRTKLEGAALLESVVASLAAEWSRPTNARPLTQALSDAGGLRVEDFPLTVAADGAVVLAAWEKAPDAAALAIGKAMARADVSVVGCEQVDADNGVAKAFASEGMSAVNDLGTARGEYTLARLLTGSVTGYFGIGTSTDGPFAPLPGPAASK